MGVVVVALSLSTRLNAIKLKYVSALRTVPSVVTLLCKLKCNKELELELSEHSRAQSYRFDQNARAICIGSKRSTPDTN